MAEDDPFAEETDDPVKANERNFYKVERWDDHGHITAMAYAGNRLDKAKAIFDAECAGRPAGRYTVRQRGRVLHKWGFA